MPIVNREDAVEVESRIGRIFSASSSARAGEIRALFVEVLYFDPASGDVGLGAAPGNTALPEDAEGTMADVVPYRDSGGQKSGT